MSIIQEYRQIEAEIEALQKRLESLGGDDRLQKELEFEEKLRSLLGEYNKSLRDVIALIDPPAGLGKAKVGAQEKTKRRARTTKVYSNPHTGERIETKGGNHKVLKQWKSEHGSDEVESWLQS